MEGSRERLDAFAAKMFGNSAVQPIEKLLLSLGEISCLVEGGIKDDIISQIKRKLFEYKGLCITKTQMKRILEVIVESTKSNVVNMRAIDKTFKEVSLPIDLDTTTTVIIGDKPDETQYEFKSIIEDVNKGIELLEKKNQKGVQGTIDRTDSFITGKQNDRQKREEEIKIFQEGREKPVHSVYERPHRGGSVSYAPPEVTQIDKCSEIISKINGIISHREHPVSGGSLSTSAGCAAAKRLETYETHFNQKVVSLLNELTDKLKASGQKRALGAKEWSINDPPPTSVPIPETENPTNEQDGLSNFRGGESSTGTLSASKDGGTVANIIANAGAYFGVGVMVGVLCGAVLRSTSGPY